MRIGREEGSFEHAARVVRTVCNAACKPFYISVGGSGQGARDADRLILSIDCDPQFAIAMMD
jgi:hypothetical protein